MASMRAVSTRLVVFDTSVVDLTDELDDPVDVLFGTQLGGGTDINRAVGYCQGAGHAGPTDTIFVLISDLYEGGVARGAAAAGRAMLVGPACTVIVLLALSDDGAPGVRPRARCAAGRARRAGIRLHPRPRSRA